MVVRIGCLAIQGGFSEHLALLRRCTAGGAAPEAVEVRTAEELASVDGLVIPGGESTAMAKVSEWNDLTDKLRAFASSGKPIWGTCAGLIFLAERCTSSSMKQGGQVLIGGLDVLVHRNFFGAQVGSFEQALPAHGELKQVGEGDTFRAVFIRAPAILEAGPGVEVLARYALTAEEKAREGRDHVLVAVRQGKLLATSFHPELTADTRWHQLFVNMVEEASAAADNGPQFKQTGPLALVAHPDLPVYVDRLAESAPLA